MDDRETEKRIIVIGSDGYWGVKTALWTAEEMPNIADYETVIVDTFSLTSLLENVGHNSMSEKTKQFLKGIYSNMIYVKDRLINVLHSQGTIYVICSPEIRLTYGNYSNYDWFPFQIELVHEKGETIDIVDDSFAHYFQFAKKWSFCFEEISRVTSEVTIFYKHSYYVKPEWEVIAKNRYTRPIAITAWYVIHQLIERDELKKAMASVYGFKNYKSEVEHTSGKIVLLPPPPGIDKILLPGEESLKQEIKRRRAKIQKLEAEISDLETRNNEEKAKFKQLLYETGGPLEDICKLTLSKLGGTVDDSVEDFILIKGGKEAIVEVKGREGTIPRGDGSQLAQNRRNYVVQKGKSAREVKAILLGNPWRLEFPLEERAKKEPFAPHLVKDAKVEDMALVTTVELLKAYCAFLKNKVSSKEIIERLFSGIGLTKLLEE